MLVCNPYQLKIIFILYNASHVKSLATSMVHLNALKEMVAVYVYTVLKVIPQRIVQKREDLRLTDAQTV